MLSMAYLVVVNPNSQDSDTGKIAGIINILL